MIRILLTVVTLLGHVGLDALAGWALLSFKAHDRSRLDRLEMLMASVLVGMYTETLLVGVLLVLGLSLVSAGWLVALALVGVVAAAALMKRLRWTRPVVDMPRWYEWAAIAAIAEQILFAMWQLVFMHAYFDDALTHWSGRARALYGGVNWSFDPSSPFFLGGYIGNRSYPLQIIIWRALSAKWNGGWDDVVARADGLLFFIVIVGTVWAAVFRFSKNRGLAAAAAFVVASVPLHAWHAAAGYADIAVEAFVLGSLAAILRREWLLGGVLAAGAIWTKNDGIFLYLPAILATTCMLQVRWETRSIEWRNILRFVLGLITVAPWLIYNRSHALGLTSGQGGLGWHREALGLLWDALMKNPSSSILWIGVLACIIYTAKALIQEDTGRALLVGFAVVFGAVVFTFTSTSATEFLSNGMTIHRVLMQFSGIAVIVVSYGLWLKMPLWIPSPAPQPEPKRKKSKARG